MANSSSGLASKARRFLPILGWIRAYRHEWLLPDVFAGVALWAVMVPEGMAYADIVGVPPIMGLYTIVPALLAYALLGTSRQLVVGPDTATGLISAVTVGAVATQGTAEFNSLTSTLAVLIGIFFFSFGVMRMGWVASFIPTPSCGASSKVSSTSPLSARCRIYLASAARRATFSRKPGMSCSICRTSRSDRR